MHTDPAPATQPDLSSMLGDVRAAIAAEGPHKGLAGTVQAVILHILEMLATLLLDFRAGRLAAGGLAAGPLAAGPAAEPDAGAAGAEDTEACAASAAPGEPGGPTLDAGCRALRTTPWFRRHDWIPADWVPACAGMTARAVTFAGMTRKIEPCAVPSDGIAQTQEPHELGAAPRPRRCGIAAWRTQSTLVVRARWWVTPRVREAYPPYGWDGDAIGSAFLKNPTWRARKGATLLFQHKNDVAITER
jgi:hypothetical protein